MNKILFLFLLLIFPAKIFSQPNHDAAKIKREKIREVRLYWTDKDSLPHAYLYYDKEGRIRKEVSQGI